ncbi:C4-dicarboxylate transporter DcuC [Campylobacter sp. RM12327]|uniref:C4-dicarboxylate transporter DcuC n=1 Tax=Campylobacter sputorum TaxID=206 RepID=UPI000B788A9A|nr:MULTISPECIES: C4-dicarboxylate transporter DcuC [Campylobacter]ASM40691.1 putative C4-dicarboxylate transporter, DcuC family [Campylobacter sputorum]MBE7358599.1 C4-dicarboxylate transporter DcuC [Campylobacter sp. RM11302]MBF6669930.1 C4-dicarboxylate transporter DcuC [Campylobacter sp. RM12327]MBF6675092.1 C4-dicarboxylate transporter DcuC [Campylobacter sp. RM13538]MBF6676708.1 C4-dicarboxylate transporter DcuC [Campylobacter sp. RM12321]
METLRLFLSLVGIFAVVFLLIKKHDTKTVLIGVGLILCVICLQPMSAFAAFTKSMTNANLIKAICASMGFAYVMKVTKCDQHLVALLTKPIKNLGFFLIPLTTILTYFINIAIPSAAGCSAAVGATLIPLLMASGVRPSMAAASVLAGTFGSVLSPGASHNIYVTDLVVKSGNAAYTVQDVIKVQMPNAFVSLVIVAICISIMAIILKDYDKTKDYTIKANAKDEGVIKSNVIYALMPIIPLAILVIGGTGLSDTQFLKWTKMGVAEAMILGAIISIFATWTDPQKITKEFFNGMGSAYAEIMGIIIAASVFVAGLTACGAIEWVIEFLKSEQTYVKFGGTFIPFIMGIVTGSGDAATMAFNAAITVHAADLGFAQDKLGMAAEIAGSLGRSASPIAGACIVCAGIAMANPVELAKRTFLGMFISTVVIAFFIL